MEVVLDENGNPIESSFKNEAEEYLKQKAQQRKQEAERIKAMHIKRK